MPVVIPSANSHDTGPCCHPATTSVNECAAADGSPASRHKNAANWPRFSPSSGENVVAVVPVVIPSASSHDTGSCWPGSVTSVNECASAAEGWPSMFHNQTAISPRDAGRSGSKQAPSRPVTSPSTDHCTGSVNHWPSATSPYPATAPADDAGNTTAANITPTI